MKLPNKLPLNIQEAKDMFKGIAEQVIVKVSEVCNKVGKKLEEASQHAKEKKEEPKKPESPESDKK